MRVIGLDLSLTRTGVAGDDVGVLVPPKGQDRGMPRLRWIRNRVLARTVSMQRCSTLVVLEGYAMGSSRMQSHAHALGEIGGVIRLALYENDIPYVDVSPASLKKYATGKGNAPKDLVLAEAIRRLGYLGSDNNEADAIWLRQMALDHYNLPGVVGVPKTHRAALDGVQWPRMNGDIR